MRLIQKRAFSFAKCFFAALFLITQLSALLSPVFAQSAATYTQLRDIPTIDRALPNDPRIRDYDDFFVPTSRLVPSTAVDWVTNPPKFASDLTFTLLDAQFNASQGNAEWHWNKIADNESGRDLFVLRFCNVGDDGKPLESSCALAAWPYGRKVYDDNALTAGGFTEEEKQVVIQSLSTSGAPGTTVTALINSINEKLRVLKTKKIHHYDAVLSRTSVPMIGDQWFLKTDVEIDNFSSSYQPSENPFGGFGSKPIEPGKRYQADLWYCAARGGGLGGDASNRTVLERWGTQSERVRIFDGRCDDSHLAYIRLAGFQFTAPRTQEEGTALNSQNQDPNINSNTGSIESGDVLPKCAWFGIGAGSFAGCLAKGVYYLIYRPIAWIASLFGNLFDFFLGYSLSDEAYRLGFAVEGWRLIRDIANIFFILILVWTGFAAVFGIGSISMKRVVPTLIVNALIINFSLFATRVVIDISNVAARVFYNTMQVQDKDGTEREIAGYKELSVLIVSAFDPQKIFETQALQSGASGDEYCQNSSTERCNDSGSGTLSATNIGASIEQDRLGGRGSGQYAGFFIVVSILAAMIMISVAKMFWKAGFFFLGRTIGLYVCMIFSPFAFLTRGNVPLVGNTPQLKWSDWSKELIKYATLAPVFILFLYIIVLFVKSAYRLNLTGGSFLETLVGVAVPMLIIYFLMKQAISIAETYAGRFGAMVGSFVDSKTGGFSAVVGGGIGLAAGGAAFAGRNTLGRMAQGIGNIKNKDGKTVRERLSASTTFLGKAGNYTLNRATTGSWDPRNLSARIGNKDIALGTTVNDTFELLGEKITDKISKKAGIDKEKGLGKGDKPGGILAIDKKRAENRAKRLLEREKRNYSHLSDDEAKAAWKQYKDIEMKKALNAHLDQNKEEKEVYEKQMESITTLKRQQEGIQKDIDDARASNNTTLLAINEERLKKNKESIEQEQKITDEISKKATEKTVERLAKYGTIKNGSAFAMAKYADYLDQLEYKSNWLTGGAKGALGMLGLSLAGFVGPVVGGALLADFADQFGRAFGNIDAKAAKKIIDDARKSQGRGNREVKLSEDIEALDKKIFDAIKNHTGKVYTKFSDITDAQEIDDAVTNETVRLEEEIKNLDRNASDYAFQKRKRERAIDRLRDIMDDRERLQEKLDRIKDNKEKSEKEKPKEEKKDDKK